MRKAALAGVRARAEMIRSPSFSRDSESRTTMASPRAVGRVVLVGLVLSRRAQTAGGDEPNASMASGMVLKAGLEVPFGCWWGDIVGGCLV